MASAVGAVRRGPARPLTMLLASVIVAALAQFASASTAGKPHSPVKFRSKQAVDEQQTLLLKWADASGHPRPKDYLVSWAKGLSTPLAIDDSAHTTTEHNFRVGGLTENTVYTFAVRARGQSGRVSDPAVLHASTRAVGFYLLDDNHPGNLRTQSGPLYGDGRSGAAVMQPDAHLRTAEGAAENAYYSSRTSATSGWSKPRPVLQSVNTTRESPVFIDATKSGRVVVANFGFDCRSNRCRRATTVRDRVNNKWRGIHYLSEVARERVVGVTGDASGREHVLIHRAAPNGGLFYFTRLGNGKWSHTRVTGTTGADVGLLTRDQQTNKVVLLDGHRTAQGSTVRYTLLAPTATAVTGWHTWLTSGSSLTWKPSSVTSNGGRITAGLRRTSTHQAHDGLYVMWARGATHHRPVRVPGTSRRDGSLVVTAVQTDNVELSWRRTSKTWDPNVMGVYAAGWSGDANASNWTFSAPSQWTNSAYDFPVAAFRASDGHVYVTYRTTSYDVTE